MRIELYKPNKIFRKMFWVTISIVLFSGLISSVFADFDTDGDQDVFITNSGQANKFYINNQSLPSVCG